MTDTNFYSGETLYASALDAAFGECIDRGGDTMSGMLTLAMDPVNPLDAVTLRYLDNTIGARLSTLVVISDNPPASPLPGTLWWDSVGGELYLWYQDPNTSQWVVATSGASQPLPGNDLPLMGGTASAGSSLLWSREDHTHPSDTSRAPTASPTFTGVPIAPTATTGTNNSQLATTAYVQNALAANVVGVASFNTRTGTVTLTNVDVTTVLPGASTPPAMNGTAAVGTSGAWARADHTHPSDTSRMAVGATAGGDLTGTYPNPTLAATTVASGSYTYTALTVDAKGRLTAASSGTAPPTPSSTNPLMDGSASFGSSLLYSRQDHVHPTDTTRAPLASPTFTGTVTIPAGAAISGYAPLASPAFTGTPSLPTGATGFTQAPSTNNTSLATTAFVTAAILAAPAVASFNTRTGAVTLTNADVVAALPASTTTPLMDGTASYGTGGTWARADHVHPSDTSRASLVSPAFTGVPTAPTPVSTDNSTTLATTAYVQSVASSYLPLAGGTLTGNLTVSSGGVTVTGPSTMSGGTTFSGGASFGSTVAAAPNNLSNHIAIYGTNYGFSVTSGSLNYVNSATVTNHTWYGGSTIVMQLVGVSSPLSVPGLVPGTSTTPVQVYPLGTTNNLLLGGPSNGSGVLATTATAGFPMMPTCAGTPTGVPVNGTKAASFVYNTTSHTLDIYDPVAAGWYHIALTAGAG